MRVSNLCRVQGIVLVIRLAIVVALECFIAPNAAHAAGQTQDFGDSGTADDAVRRVLLATSPIPKDIFEIRQRLEAHGGNLKAHLVVNGGHDNPTRTTEAAEKFMAFETYSNATPGKTVDEDELFFGFFLGEDHGTLVARPGFVELIAWDRTKQVYNFWELLGTGWHYRGDSNDVLTDIMKINVADASPQFKDPPVLRCSGCHTLGGPIMKELAEPHNDWWTRARKFNLGPYTLQAGIDATNPAHVAARLFDEAKEATDAANLSTQVKKGIDRLLSARAKRGGDGQNLRQQLRSLFTSMEINLVSDRVSLQERMRKNEAVELSQEFFVDSRLVEKSQPIPVKIALYKDALINVGSQFAPGETLGLMETHHAFLVPARSYIDNQMIRTLLQQGILDDELVADVLAVDFTTPVFSAARASLIKFVPDTAENIADLRKQLIAALEKAPLDDRVAKELLTNLTDPARTAAAHRQAAAAYLAICAKTGNSRDVAVDWLTVASQRRLEIAAAETARHPEGKITEPGFRMIFPVHKQQAKVGKFRLDSKTGRAVSGTP